jgi:hypothetical protein
MSQPTQPLKWIPIQWTDNKVTAYIHPTSGEIRQKSRGKWYVMYMDDMGHQQIPVEEPRG